MSDTFDPEDIAVYSDPEDVDLETIMKYIDDNDDKEGTEVIRVNDGRRTMICSMKSPRNDGQLCAFSVTEMEPTSTLEEIKNDFAKKLDEWKESACWKDLETVLRRLLSEGHISVDNCVLLGSGCVSSAKFGDELIPETRERSLLQFAVFYSVASLIGSCQNDKPPKLYAQEPSFNNVDREFCDSLGIQCVDHPVGFDVITSNSFAYCPGAEQIVDLRCFQQNPALYLGGEADLWHDAFGRLRSRFEAIHCDARGRMLSRDEGYSPEDALCAQIVQNFMATHENHVLPKHKRGAAATWLIYKKE